MGVLEVALEVALQIAEQLTVENNPPRGDLFRLAHQSKVMGVRKADLLHRLAILANSCWPGDPAILTSVAEALVQAGDTEGARRLLEQAADIVATATSYVNVAYGAANIAYCYAMLGNRQTAAAFAETALQAVRKASNDEPAVFAAIRRLAATYARLGDSGALRTLRAEVEAYTSRAFEHLFSSLAHIVQAMVKVGDIPAALETLEEMSQRHMRDIPEIEGTSILLNLVETLLSDQQQPDPDAWRVAFKALAAAWDEIQVMYERAKRAEEAGERSPGVNPVKIERLLKFLSVAQRLAGVVPSDADFSPDLQDVISQIRGHLEEEIYKPLRYQGCRYAMEVFTATMRGFIALGNLERARYLADVLIKRMQEQLNRYSCFKESLDVVVNLAKVLAEIGHAEALVSLHKMASTLGSRYTPYYFSRTMALLAMVKGLAQASRPADHLGIEEMIANFIIDAKRNALWVDNKVEYLEALCRLAIIMEQVGITDGLQEVLDAIDQCVQEEHPSVIVGTITDVLVTEQ